LTINDKEDGVGRLQLISQHFHHLLDQFTIAITYFKETSSGECITAQEGIALARELLPEPVSPTITIRGEG